MHQPAYKLSSQPFAGPMPLQTFKSYKNDLFGDEDGDVLAAETIPAAKPIEVAVPRPTTPSNRVQQQIALNQQKRLARLQVTDPYHENRPAVAAFTSSVTALTASVVPISVWTGC